MTTEVEHASAAPRVLVVDDAAVDRHKAAAIITQELGWRVTQADNGRAALEAVELDCPDVVVTDLQMPEMDGLALVAALHARYPFLPVVLMTAYGSEEVAVEALRKGAASYVPKRSLSSVLSSTLIQVRTAVDSDRRRTQLLRDCLRETESYYVLQSDPALIGTVVSRLQDDLCGMGLCGDSRRLHLGIALEETLTNALYHGNLELGSVVRKTGDTDEYRRAADERRARSPYRDRHLHIRSRLSRSQAAISVRDEGPGYDPNTLPDPTDPANMVSASGRGLLLIRTFVDEVGFNGTGNEITLWVRPRPAPQTA